MTPLQACIDIALAHTGPSCTADPVGYLTKACQPLLAFELDAMRYRWLKSNIGERLTEASCRGEFSEHKTQFVFPKLIAWADFCGPIPLDEAIDNAIELDAAQAALEAT